MTEADLLELDPGIRQLVFYLRGEGYNTTDSGDGVSKFEGLDPDAKEDTHCIPLAYPHVFMTTEAHDLRHAADELDVCISKLQPTKPYHVAASYSPSNGVALLEVIGLVDSDCTFPKD